jgi:hypothetical protein
VDNSRSIIRVSFQRGQPLATIEKLQAGILVAHEGWAI